MTTATPGSRHGIDGATDLRVRPAKNDRDLVVLAIDGGAVRPAERDGDSWLCRIDGDRVEIVVGTIDGDRPMADFGPFRIEVGAHSLDVVPDDGTHRAVILAEAYRRGDDRRLKISGEGYVYGLESLARRRGLDALTPGRRRPEPSRQEGSRPVPGPGRGRVRPDPRWQGSGCCVGPGVVITNHHVVDGASLVHIGHDGGWHVGRVVAKDAIHDLALVRVDSIPGLETAPFRDAASLYLGEPVMAAGHPLAEVLGDDLKTTFGDVSGLKGLEGDVSRLQFTAPIASGSSGGALFDHAGRLVAITSAALSHEFMRSRGGTSENVNFAVKASMVAEMLVACGIDVPPVGRPDAIERAELTRAARRRVVAVSCS